MIVKVQDALDYIQRDIPEADIIKKIKGIERLIRDETNNKFQERRIRFKASTNDTYIIGSSPFISVGDTIEISESMNAGLYTVIAITQQEIMVDAELYPISDNLITKIVYPESVVKGVLDMLKWEYAMRDKVGIKSESLSRHSVSYYDMDAANSLAGYPASLIGFLDPYYNPRY